MRCPCCEKELTVTHQDRYESMDEHVSGGEPSMKNGYQCTDMYCVGNNLGVTWILEGDPFVDPPEGIKSSVAFEMLKKLSVTGNYYALDSWNSKYEKMQQEKKRLKKKLSIGKWKADIYPVFSSNDDGEWKRKRFKFKVELWKKTPEGTYTNFIPTHTMVIFSLKKFTRNMGRAIEGETSAMEECYNTIQCLSSWGEPDKRSYARISSFLVKIMFPTFSASMLEKFPQMKK